jgi:L-asparaginase/N4-(beta-N-acetylglucosaminyl)-L-asparaginase
MRSKITRRNFLLGAAAAGIAVHLESPIAAAAPQEIQVPLVISTWRHGLAANEAAWKVLSAGGSALDAVEAGVRVSEADPEVSSVGLGGIPNSEGVVELDAAIMDGTSRDAGSVASIQRIKHPVSVARKVMEKTRHVMLVGDGARRFAVAQGFPEEDLLTEKAKAAHERWKAAQGGEAEGKDTIGMVALDGEGRIAAACTTSGLSFKLPGRVGDSPIIGAGLYADAPGGASATGIGEEVIKVCGSFLIVESMRRGASPQAACEGAVRRILEGHPENAGKQVAFIALSPAGETGAAAIRKGFRYALRDARGGRLIEGKALGGS